ncbi:hypothetical protein HID58_095229 [Brassica napus]|uniref:Uncharacterized protein n=1 Tax=Brassica napus TaxID=3708 RepID=A0ABQ7X6T3_BRANA|nr:hypothetical protein HID58_095229 [Brassica napus]
MKTKWKKREVDPQDLKYVNEIKRVLELLRRNRDMMFNEVKLTIMIEDPRELEKRRLLGIEEDDAPSREDLAEALELVNEGKIPKDRLTLQMLYEEMVRWPNLEGYGALYLVSSFPVIIGISVVLILFYNSLQ